MHPVFAAVQCYAKQEAQGCTLQPCAYVCLSHFSLLHGVVAGRPDMLIQMHRTCHSQGYGILPSTVVTLMLSNSPHAARVVAGVLLEPAAAAEPGHHH